MSTSASSASPSSTAVVDLITPKNDRRILSVIIVLSIVGAFVIGGVVWYTLRLKRRDKEYRLSAGPFHGTQIYDKDHPASRITPFGAGPANSPSFDYRPGEDMRIAHRRADGAWLFADSRTPFAPTGVSDLENVPSSAASSKLFPFSPHYNPSKKEEDTKLDDPFASSYDPVTPPPPAYQRHAKENPFS